MKDESVSLGCSVAYGSWSVSAGFLIGGIGAGAMWLFACMIFTLGIAVTATIRTYFVEFSNMVRKAFELDRETVTSLPRRP